MSSEDLAIRLIQKYFRIGSYSAEDILAKVECEFEDLDPQWMEGQIEEAWRCQVADEATWGFPTDCDRLDDAFAALWGQNIIALQNAGDTDADGWENLKSYWTEMGGPMSAVTGYCYFHEQDVELAMQGGGLVLISGDIQQEDQKTESIFRMVCAALEKQGFSPVKEAASGRRIILPGFRWQKRRGSHEKQTSMVNAHCERLEEPFLAWKKSRPLPSGCFFFTRAGMQLLVAYAGLIFQVFGTFMLHQRLIAKDELHALPPLTSAALLVVGAFLVLFGFRFWGRWLYLVPILALPVIFLILVADFADFLPSAGRDIESLVIFIIMLVFGWQTVSLAHGYYAKRK